MIHKKGHKGCEEQSVNNRSSFRPLCPLFFHGGGNNSFGFGSAIMENKMGFVS